MVDGSSVRIVDTAVVPSKKAAPSTGKNTMLGFLLGAVLACGAVVVLYLMDDKIHSADYLLSTYDIPMLAVIPDLTQDGDDGYYGYGYGSVGRKERG